ncbi:hypothetical protein AGR13a_Cc180002 [Agrobacterium genomosp. 13 str. CFBP 6927]|uniref:Transposase n=1 Tax=Agrobacterium genomosp. 13 str. CFBP 6927 TaxID=1183428 RepID=A0ABM9VCC2_9HYPH|nr:hypothetical protein AGR13a_Cc180002 [Agrobacterium genomosp. 13 str. CFBP 6927]
MDIDARCSRWVVTPYKSKGWNIRGLMLAFVRKNVWGFSCKGTKRIQTMHSAIICGAFPTTG